MFLRYSSNKTGTEICPLTGRISVPVLPVRAGAYPTCRSRMDSHCTNRWGVQRGNTPFGSGFPIEASSIPVGTRLSRGNACVLYLCFRLTPGRGWLHHLLCGQIAVDRHFLATVGQADFVRTRTKLGFVHRAKSACPEKEAKVYHPLFRRSDSDLVSLLPPWISHGSCRHCTGFCTVDCKRRRWTGCPGTPSGSACTDAGDDYCPPA